jgi:hypothetical protein
VEALELGECLYPLLRHYHTGSPENRGLRMAAVDPAWLKLDHQVDNAMALDISLGLRQWLGCRENLDR